MRGFITEQPTATYEPSTPTTEGDYERQVLRCSLSLFPGYFFAPWKPIIRDWQNRKARPDAILVSRDIQSWYVVEVELNTHSIQNHISPQLETLDQGIYDSTLFASISDALPEVDQDKLASLIYRPPGRLCIVNTFSAAIQAVCRENDFELAVLEPYLDVNGKPAMAVSILPSSLREPSRNATFGLGRGVQLGDKEFMILPPHFPAWHGDILVVDTEGKQSSCRIHSDNRQRKLIVPRELAHPRASVHLEPVDLSRRVFRLEINK